MKTKIDNSQDDRIEKVTFKRSKMIKSIIARIIYHQQFPQHSRLIALDQPYSGDLHGVRGADYECYRQANYYGIKGTFKAFLASRQQNLDTIVRPENYDNPVINLKVIIHKI